MSQSGVEAVDKELQSACPDTMDIEQFLSELDLRGVPTKQTTSLTQQGRSLRLTLSKDARDAAGISLKNAGCVETYHYSEHGIVLIDLNSHQPKNEP